MRRIPRIPPKRPASKTTLSRGEACPDSAAAGRRTLDGRPVVLGEHERGEVHFVRQLDQALERRRPGVEGRRPGIDACDVLQASRQRLHQLRLLS